MSQARFSAVLSFGVLLAANACNSDEASPSDPSSAVSSATSSIVGGLGELVAVAEPLAEEGQQSDGLEAPGDRRPDAGLISDRDGGLLPGRDGGILVAPDAGTHTGDGGGLHAGTDRANRAANAVSGGLAQGNGSTCSSASLGGEGLTVDYNGCTGPNGKTVTGQLVVGVQLDPFMATVSFNQLNVGTTQFNGSSTLSMPGGGQPITLTVDLTVQTPQGTITLQGATLTLGAAGTTVNGTGSHSDGSDTVTMTLSEVFWKKGDCLPSSGQMTITEGSVTTTITFLDKTPAEGVVRVQVGVLPAVETQLLSPCP